MTADARPLLALEISPMEERFHTGIANVAKHLARELLGDGSVEGRFFFHRGEIPREQMRRLVELDTGSILPWLAERVPAPPVFGIDPDRAAIGLFTNHKHHRRLFPTEVQVVHDLTSLVTPAFHTAKTVKLENGLRFADLASCDLIVTVSDSTATDLGTYHPELDGIPRITVPLAAPASAPRPRTGAAESYVLVLGTLEPRKNVEGVLRLLAEEPAWLERLRFVFVGRFGWGESVRTVIDQLGLGAAVEGGRLRFTGFVPDGVRDALLAHARCVIYPSRYEGFGLPIVESLRAGVPVVTGFGSSLGEAGGDVATYCDVAQPAAIGAALARVLSETDGAGRARRQDWAASFTWTRTYTTIRDAALPLAASRRDGA